MDTKRLSQVEIKDAGRGEVRAVFSTLNVKDSDGDVTESNAFDGNGEVPISAYGHASWQGALPVGKGTMREVGDEAVFDGQFFMDTTPGKDTFLTVKALADAGLGEWSYGYDVLEWSKGEFNGDDVRFLKKLKVHEVSPVLVGAGVNTRTLSAKSASVGGGRDAEFKAAIRPHKSSVTNRVWDGSAVVAAVPDAASVSELRSVYAWVDSSADPESKSSYRFPHHHGIDGPANIRALVAGIAALNGARGGVAIPKGDRDAVYKHLAAHLRDADREPPELRSLDGGPLALHEEAIGVLAGISEYLESAKRVAALRAQKGKSLSQINAEALEWVGEELDRLAIEHKALMRRLEDTPREATAEELVRFLATQHARRAS